MQSYIKIIFALSFGLLTGCATVVRGTSEPFMVVTDPPGAIVSTTLETAASKKARKNNPMLTSETYGCEPTPCEIELPRRSKFIAKVEKPGFEPVRVTVLSKAGKSGKAAGSVAPGAVMTIAASEIAAANSTSLFFLVDGAWQMAGATTGAVMIGAPLTFIDAASGAMLSLYPNPVGIKLAPLSETPPNKDYSEQLITLE